MHPYLELGYISHVPLEQDYRAQSIVTDQGLDLRTGRQAMEADGEKLTRSSVYIPFPVSLVFCSPVRLSSVGQRTALCELWSRVRS